MLRVALPIMAIGLATIPASLGAQKMYPPGIIDSAWWPDLIDDEPRLWQLGRLQGFKTRYRLAIAGINRLRALVRIDEKHDGSGIGRVALVRRSDPGRSLDLIADADRTFRVSAKDMALLRTRIAAANLWSIGPEEHWYVKDDICLDGEQLAFERLDADGYRFSEANAQCTAPPVLLVVAQTMIELSGERRALGLLQ
ncbi:MAG: hypothetical protein JWM94_502 [Sphingomonas bacterium]|nr:hypothetical protein [Sphingomonas bacterium]